MAFEDDIEAAIDMMRRERRIYKNYLSLEAMDMGYRIYNASKDLDGDILNIAVVNLIEEMPWEFPYPAVWWYSVICNIKKSSAVFLEFIRYIRNHIEAFSGNTLYYLYYQCKGMAFEFPSLDSSEGKLELWNLLLDSVKCFEQKLSVSLEPVPYEARNHNLIVVVTEQLLSPQHGPTKTALDRCKVIIDKLDKTVLLINTGEILSNVGRIPLVIERRDSGTMYDTSDNPYILLDWKGTMIPYFQCRKHMPDVDILEELLMVMRELAPERIVSIGGSSIFTGLVSKMIPVLTVGLLPSDLECTANSYQTLSRKMTEADIEMLKSLGFAQNHVIECVFTSSLLPQTEKISKGDLGISEEAFLLAVVGARLDTEITDEFLDMLEELEESKLQVIFLGVFQGYEAIIQKHTKLVGKVSYLGFCDDILSRMEVCDLYINPIRKGGGTSCVEAMYMGVPVITTSYGDVSINAGEEFCVRDYCEMKKKIMQYYTDELYYEKMSQIAKSRAKVLLDTETEFVKVLEEATRREL